MRGSEQNNLAVSRWMITRMGSMFRVQCSWEMGGASGVITNDSGTLGLDSWESEVVGGTCGTAGRSGVRMDRMSNL